MSRRKETDIRWNFEEGQRVVKRNGYPFPGIVVVRFRTLVRNHERYIVDFTDANGDPTGLMHIFSWDQLEAAPSNDPRDAKENWDVGGQ